MAAKLAVELIMEIRYKLNRLGFPIDGPATLSDNMLLVLNTTVSSSMLKKKLNAIVYHYVREACATGIIPFSHIGSTMNVVDILTKPLPNKTCHGFKEQINKEQYM